MFFKSEQQFGLTNRQEQFWIRKNLYVHAYVYKTSYTFENQIFHTKALKLNVPNIFKSYTVGSKNHWFHIINDTHLLHDQS